MVNRVVAAALELTRLHESVIDVYDRAYPSALRKLLRRAAFNVLDPRVGYCQAGYFDFFLPLYLLNVACELVISTLRLENLAANMLVVARKP